MIEDDLMPRLSILVQCSAVRGRPAKIRSMEGGWTFWQVWLTDTDINKSPRQVYVHFQYIYAPPVTTYVQVATARGQIGHGLDTAPENSTYIWVHIFT